MYEIALIVMLLGSLITFGADKLFRKGKIRDMKQLLIVKVIGLVVTIIGVISLIISK